ncbi:MAG: 4'-phosphopantetheinyl transferase family protein [Polyangiaceae bacterium]
MVPAAPHPWIPPPLLVPGAHARATAYLGVATGPAARAREHAAGRLCAAQALRDAGSTEVEVGAGPRRNPLWPAGFTGSITHTAALAWAAVVPTGVMRSLGIDSEPVFDEASLREAGTLALDDVERGRLRPGHEASDATIVFSAKESLFKCVDPCVGAALELADVRVAWTAGGGPGDGVLEVLLLRDLSRDLPRGRSLPGRYATSRGHVHTAVWLPS